MEATVQQNHAAGVEFLAQAIEILEWGYTEFEDVNVDDKGSIFRESFIRGVRVLYMEAYMKASSLHQRTMVKLTDIRTRPP